MIGKMWRLGFLSSFMLAAVQGHASFAIDLNFTGGLAGGVCCTGYVSSQGDVTYELMTGWLNMPTFVSQTTVQSFADIGFVTVPVPEPDVYAMMLFAFGLIGWQLRRRRRHVAACRFT